MFICYIVVPSCLGSACSRADALKFPRTKMGSDESCNSVHPVFHCGSLSSSFHMQNVKRFCLQSDSMDVLSGTSSSLLYLFCKIIIAVQEILFRVTHFIVFFSVHIVPCSLECKCFSSHLIGRCNICSIPPPGTRIIYDRKFLLDCRNSPIARTPPCCLPQIPGVTVPSHHPMSKLQELKEELEEEKDLAGKMAVCSRKKRKPVLR